jgi:hypothetical protein
MRTIILFLCLSLPAQILNPIFQGGNTVTSITLVQQSLAANCVYSTGSSFTCALPAAPTRGNVLWLQESARNTTANITSVTQAGVTWTSIQTGNTKFDAEIWCGQVFASAVATATIGLANGQSSNVGNLAEFSGTAPCAAYDTGASADNSNFNGQNFTTATVTPNAAAGNQCLFLATVAWTSSSTYHSGPTNSFIALNSSAATQRFAYQIVASLSGSSYSTKWTTLSGTTAYETEITGVSHR